MSAWANMLQQQETLLNNCCFSVRNHFNSSSVWVFHTWNHFPSIYCLSAECVCVSLGVSLPFSCFLSIPSPFFSKNMVLRSFLKGFGGLALAVSISELNLSFNTQKMNRITFSRYDCPFTAADSRAERSVNKDAAANICWE